MGIMDNLMLGISVEPIIDRHGPLLLSIRSVHLPDVFLVDSHWAQSLVVSNYEMLTILATLLVHILSIILTKPVTELNTNR